MSNKSIDLEDELDYEIDEIEEKFGSGFSQMVSKTIKNKPPKKNKNLKFHKDGWLEKDKK